MDKLPEEQKITLSSSIACNSQILNNVLEWNVDNAAEKWGCGGEGAGVVPSRSVAGLPKFKA